ncbi:MAG: deoxyribonuclease IV [Candidatus Poribacteria bacterium]|nr:deoxyribonuclease IV [Candidatus Poribacteria bacterium]
MLLGAHVSTAGGLYKSIENGEKLECEAIQIFVKSPNRWVSKEPTEDDTNRFKASWQASAIQSVLIHDIHLTNLTSPKPEVLENSRDQVRSQLQLADILGIPYFVTHMGAHLDAGEDEGLRLLSESLNLMFEQTAGGEVMVLLETTAGQGSNLGYTFEHLRQTIDSSKYPERLGVCLDTCHVFVAGYDIRTEDAYHETFDEFDRVIGLDRLRGFHLNDAKAGYQSRKDRHEHIGEGNLGELPFKLLLNDSRFADVPMVIETPKMEEMHATNLAVLRSLIES